MSGSDDVKDRNVEFDGKLETDALHDIIFGNVENGQAAFLIELAVYTCSHPRRLPGRVRRKEL